jgi:hypothetical protein
MKDEIKADLTNREDLSMAVMNLISIEEHLAFTAMKTGNEFYLEVLNEVRKIRIDLLKKLLVNTSGELWCISKHLLSGTMRLMETSTKYLRNDTKYALQLEKKAFDLYSLFWLLQGMDGTEGGKRNAAKKSAKKAKTKR